MRSVLMFSALVVVVGATGCSRSLGYYVERGNRFFDSGKYEEASMQYRKAIQIAPKSGEAYYRLGLTEIRRANLSDAYQALTQAVALMPNNDAARVRLADVCLAGYRLDSRATGFYNQVVTISGQLLEKNPRSFDGLRLKGLLALTDRKPKEAVGYLEQVNAIEPLHRDVILGLAHALLADNRFAAGEKLALDHIGKDQTFGVLYDVLYQAYTASKRPADAEAILKRKVDSNPKQAGYLVELAEHYARAGKFAQMSATLRRLLDNLKDFPDAHALVGDFNARHLRWPEAIGEFEQAARLQPKEKTRFQKRIVVALKAQGKAAEALQLAAAIIKADPNDDEAQSIHATLLLESGKPEDLDAALPMFQKLAQARPADPVLHFDLGRVYTLVNKPDEARIQFQEAARLRGDYRPPRVALVVLNLNQRRSQDALAGAKELFDADPSDAQGRYLYSVALTDTGNYSQARVQIGELLKRFPGSRDAQLQLALIAAAQKKFKEAEQIFNRLYQARSDDIRAVEGLVNTYFSESQFDKALQLLKEDLKKSPDSTAIRGLLANAAVSAGRYDLALEQYQKLQSQVPNSTDVRMRLADVYWRKGDPGKTISTLQQAVQADPKNPAALMFLASVLGESGRMAEARQACQQVLALKPDNPHAMNNLAFVLSETGGNLDEALRLVQTALQKSPDEPQFFDTMGCIYLRKRMFGSAVQTFNALVRQRPNNATFRYHLGWALVEEGDKARAKRELENALARQPSRAEEAKIRELLGRIG
jgi:tetratricopeptide (TPR) repeat protein